MCLYIFVLSIDCQLIYLSDSIYDYVTPYLKTVSSSASCPHVSANIAAALTTLFLKLSVLSKNKSRAAELFTHFIGRETVNAK